MGWGSLERKAEGRAAGAVSLPGPGPAENIQREGEGVRAFRRGQSSLVGNQLKSLSMGLSAVDLVLFFSFLFFFC